MNILIFSGLHRFLINTHFVQKFNKCFKNIFTNSVPIFLTNYFQFFLIKSNFLKLISNIFSNFEQFFTKIFIKIFIFFKDLLIQL